MAANYTALGYCTEIDIENFLLLDINDTFSDQITDWIAAAETRVNKFLGYPVDTGILEENIVGEKVKGVVTTDGDFQIFPNKLPVTTVSGITIKKGTSSISLELTNDAGADRYDINYDENYILIAGDEIAFDGNSILRSFYDLRSKKFFVKLDYKAGYTTVPADIRLATVNLVADTIMRQANKDGLEMITQGKVTKKWQRRQDGKSDFELDAEKLLIPYRISSRWL